MTYYYARTVEDSDLDAVIARVREALGKEGFGVLTEIDIEATLKDKIGADFRPYKILGACNPQLAHRALSHEDKIGTMLPCNLIVQQLDDNRIEVAAIDPVASMQAIDNPAIETVADEVGQRLRQVVKSF